jgi:hypothetical protein
MLGSVLYGKLLSAHSDISAILRGTSDEYNIPEISPRTTWEPGSIALSHALTPLIDPLFLKPWPYCSSPPTRKLAVVPPLFLETTPPYVGAITSAHP